MNWTPKAIKALRERKPGRTQAEFAALLGLSRAASVSDLERGKTTPKPQTVMLLNLLYEQERGRTPIESAIEEEEEEEPDAVPA